MEKVHLFLDGVNKDKTNTVSARYTAPDTVFLSVSSVCFQPSSQVLSSFHQKAHIFWREKKLYNILLPHFFAISTEGNN